MKCLFDSLCKVITSLKKTNVYMVYLYLTFLNKKCFKNKKITQAMYAAMRFYFYYAILSKNKKRHLRKQHNAILIYLVLMKSCAVLFTTNPGITKFVYVRVLVTTQFYGDKTYLQRTMVLL